MWMKHQVGAAPPWIFAAEAHAKGCYESACEEYIKALEVINHSVESGDLVQRTINAPVVEFIINRVSL